MTTLTQDLITVKLSQLQESKTNPRKTFPAAQMEELTASIREQGIVVPLLVRPLGKDQYEIVAGARRYRAAKEVAAQDGSGSGEDHIPVIIRNLSDQEALELQIIENDQRADVHPLEQCEGYERLLKAGNLSVEELADRLGKDYSYVTKRLRYVHLIEPIRKMFLSGAIGVGHANLLARLQPEQQKRIIAAQKKYNDDRLGDMTVNDLADQIEREFFLTLKDAPFDIASETLVPKAGACTVCPKRSGANKALFDDIAKDDTCTDKVCFDSKVAAFIQIQVKEHKGAIKLTVKPQYMYTSEKTEGRTDWVPAGKQSCPDTKQGVIVQTLSQDTKGHLGQVLNVCTNPKCKTHGVAQRETSGSTYKRPESDLKAERNRRIELARRGLIFKEISADKFKIDDGDRRAMLNYRIDSLSSDDARAVCYAMEWPIENAKHMGKDYQGTIKKNLKTLDDQGVMQWLFMLHLAETELWFSNNLTSAPQATLMLAKAKLAGVPLDEIAKQAKAKKKPSEAKPPKVVKAKPAKAKKIPPKVTEDFLTPGGTGPCKCGHPEMEHAKLGLGKCGLANNGKPCKCKRFVLPKQAAA